MSGWTQEVITGLAKLAAQGLSAAQACQHFNGMTRNAAVGLAKRNSFQFLGKSGGPSGGARPSSQKRDPQPKPVPVVTAPRQEIDAYWITFEELAPNDCKYPRGNSDFRFCGLAPLEGGPYCSHHAALCFRPLEERRR